ncbi:MAG: RagB/SusD family nutrient uptake outer membrane protein, partial [Prevotella sp.]|nr:RagB/SusD family nutrient uptake outer membrane protein [Prevotella sp.]
MNTTIKSFGALLIASLAISSCSDDFLKEKISYDQTTEDCYNYYSGAAGRVSDVYKWSQPDVNSGASWKFPSTGRGDDLDKCTEEFTGFGGFVNELVEYTSNTPNTVPDYGFQQTKNIQTMAWGRIRNINDVIKGISNGNLKEEEKRELLGQVYFWRAWSYYLLVKWYGGVPIITEPQEVSASSFTQRSSTKECIDFMCKDLDMAAEYLAPYTTNGGWQSSDDYGRVTSGAALALKGRILLMYASPLFNRSNDKARWQEAYDCIKASIPVLNSCGNDLAYDGNPGTNASNWALMFSQVGKVNQ